MIFLTRLDGREVVVNSDLIVTVEATPDTMVTLSTGDRILVRESVEVVVDKAVAFRYRTMQGPGSWSAELPRASVPPVRTRSPSNAGETGQQVSDTTADDTPVGLPEPDAFQGGRGRP